MKSYFIFFLLINALTIPSSIKGEPILSPEKSLPSISQPSSTLEAHEDLTLPQKPEILIHAKVRGNEKKYLKIYITNISENRLSINCEITIKADIISSHRGHLSTLTWNINTDELPYEDQKTYKVGKKEFQNYLEEERNYLTQYYGQYFNENTLALEYEFDKSNISYNCSF